MRSMCEMDVCDGYTTIPSVFVLYESGSVVVDINARGECMGWNGE